MAKERAEQIRMKLVKQLALGAEYSKYRRRHVQKSGLHWDPAGQSRSVAVNRCRSLTHWLF